jgi:hypothetical protein
MRALAAAARAFAGEIEQGLAARPEEAPDGLLAGSAASMFEVLGSIARINDDHGRGPVAWPATTPPACWKNATAADG